ncbi:MAG TPA: winged helix-turn-helix domain-containing protein [Terriglobales bacterium]|nr:winged helix-turn-helix domain-containing protein [Terriglobales bacterium]
MKTKHIYEFGSYRLDPEEKVLLRDGQAVSIPPKDLETLLVLVEKAGHIVEKEELLQKVWPGVFIEEGNLARHVFNLRQVLGEGPDGRQFIETVPKRGYRFAGLLEARDEPVYIEVAPAPTASQIPLQLRNRRRKLWPWLLAAVLTASAMIVAWRLLPKRNPPPQKVMLAVLPFANLSGDPNEDYFADGLTEELIAQLGQTQPAKLGVIARTSVVRYTHTKEPIAQIGQELGVGYVLEGSVRRGGGRVRITAQLIQAASQTHVWAETYERPLTDVLTVQKEIGERVARSLSSELLPVSANASEPPHVNLESYDKYLLGLHELELGTRESVFKAIQYLQDGITRDPNDARLYSALAEAYNSATTYYSSPAEVMPRAKEAAQRAVELDPNLASGHVKLGYVHLFFDWDWPAAEKEYRRALEINPSSPEAQLGYANYLATLGHFDEALSRVEQAYLYDPLAVESRKEALWIFYFSGRMPETIHQCRKTMELAPSDGVPYIVLAIAYARMGKHAETLRVANDAIRVADFPSGLATTASALAQVGEKTKATQVLHKALEEAKQQYVCQFLVATAYTELGDNEKALESLQQAFLQRST